MNKSVFGFFIFAAGVAAGFFAANKLMKQKYEQLVQEEIDSVKAAFGKDRPLPEKKTKPTEKEREECNQHIAKHDCADEKKSKPTEKELEEYSQRITKLGYTEEKNPAAKDEPYVIPPDEFGDLEYYDEISLTYYADGTVTDDDDRPMDEDDIEATIGKDSLTHFGEYEDDSVFVRNDLFKAYYEILMDRRSYADVLREKPYLKN